MYRLGKQLEIMLVEESIVDEKENIFVPVVEVF
jgi:hypothetical protein